MQLINVHDYWPWAPVTNTFDYGITHDYVGSSSSMKLRQFTNGAWNFDWFYRDDRARGVLEYEDDYPKTTTWQKLIFWTATVQQPCVPGKEIVWGGIQAIGDALGAPCQTSGLFGQYGWQQVSFVQLLPTFETPAGVFKNVLVVRYWQTWSGGPSKGAKMWFAKGIGQIKALWEINGVPTGFGMLLQSTSAKELVA